jgi:hypothetical protein
MIFPLKVLSTEEDYTDAKVFVASIPHQDQATEEGRERLRVRKLISFYEHYHHGLPLKTAQQLGIND